MAGTTTRNTAVAVVLAALALTATACNDDKSGSAAPAAPTSAAAQPATATPAAATPTAEPTKEAPVKLTPAAYLKLVTEKTGAQTSAKVTEEISIGGGTIKATGALSWAAGLQGELQMDMSATAAGKQLSALTGGSTLTARYLKDGMYMRVGGQAVQELGGKHWLHYSYEDLGKAQGGIGGNQLKGADPVEGVRTLIASGKVSEAGTETVGGKQTTHYTGELTVADLAAAGGSGLTDEQFAQVKKNLKAAGVTSETVDVWVDSDNLVVKRTEEADTKAGPFKVTVTYSDYGTKVATTAPDPSDVAELADVAGAAKGGAAS
ncbi:hypothetical protein RMN57_17015 [Kitasatospora sp. CM 4170]|uniref:Lipoprotein n=1 Tax=Kitasatospora aburaviensis TaxID=67265 RepID=A0ABW1ETM2_9ACTN|nr:hypothetical protein [Kitasatospora sp. CM 4170]WNM46281.1 hypothetical protein RMN57_17015 [Kitasatospora sp. CM 4170]